MRLEVIMPERGKKKASGTEAVPAKQPPRTSQPKAGRPVEPNQADQPAAGAEDGSRAQQRTLPGRTESQWDVPRIVLRDGVAHVDGCNAPVWRLEMARRAGSSPAALID